MTSSMMVRSTLRDLSQGLSRLQETQTKLATGKELTRPSVNPGATRMRWACARRCAAPSSASGR
ncbi:MAG: hypothetical protein R2713_10170 [Ilumatobacteraceae bacterium]